MLILIWYHMWPSSLLTDPDEAAKDSPIAWTPGTGIGNWMKLLAPDVLLTHAWQLWPSWGWTGQCKFTLSLSLSLSVCPLFLLICLQIEHHIFKSTHMFIRSWTYSKKRQFGYVARTCENGRIQAQIRIRVLTLSADGFHVTETVSISFERICSSMHTASQQHHTFTGPHWVEHVEMWHDEDIVSTSIWG